MTCEVVSNQLYESLFVLAVAGVVVLIFCIAVALGRIAKALEKDKEKQ